MPVYKLFMSYTRQWAKKENAELDTLSEWIKSIGDMLESDDLNFCQHQIRVHFSWAWYCPWAFPSMRILL